MNLIFSFDENYVATFKVLLYSIYSNNENESCNVYLLHYDMDSSVLEDLQAEIGGYNYSFHPINCKEYLKSADDVLVNRYYTIEMYLWLFAPYVLPKKVKRALYLDPDIINLNNIHPFYHQNFEDSLFVAMDYKIKNQLIQPINNLRLRTLWADHYFNTGVVLMNIEKIRKERDAGEIYEAVIENKAVLILPDQDIFNFLYHEEIKREAWEVFNIDPRLYQLFQFVVPDSYNLDWVEEKVVFIHYAGKNKPWLYPENYKLDLGKYYYQYEEKLFQRKMESERGRINDKTF